jgi:hypothetical protein
MYDFKTHAELGDAVGEGSGSWGWSYKNREFIAIGQTYGAAFAEVTKKGELEYLGRLPAQNDSVIWREMQVLKDTLIIGSEGIGHGVQFFDMKKLLKLSPKSPKTFDIKTDIAWVNLTQGIAGRSHTVRARTRRRTTLSLSAAVDVPVVTTPVLVDPSSSTLMTSPSLTLRAARPRMATPTTLSVSCTVVPTRSTTDVIFATVTTRIP